MVQKTPSIPLPTDWPKHVKAGILHVIALAQVVLAAARARSATKRDIIARLRAELEEAQREICLLEEELRLRDLRMGRVTPRRRPHYRGTERMAQTLARAGLRLGVSTVGRILKEGAGRQPEPAKGAVRKEPGGKVEGPPVQAKAPNHVWQVDLTLVPSAAKLRELGLDFVATRLS